MKRNIILTAPAQHPCWPALKKRGVSSFQIGRFLGVSSSHAWAIMAGRRKATEEQNAKLEELEKAALEGRLVIEGRP